MILLLYKRVLSATYKKCTHLFSIHLLQKPVRCLVIFFLLGLLPVSSFAANIHDKSHNESEKFQANNIYLALVAEMYKEIGDEKQAVDYYIKLSASHKDASIAKRMTELATMTGQVAKALNGAKRWVELEPDNLEANQYLTLLYLRNSYFKASAEQLSNIRVLIDDISPKEASLASEITPSVSGSVESKGIITNESLAFIGALLAAEAHHDKAFKVFQIYTQHYASKLPNFKTYHQQRRLIYAELAMKAKAYNEVIYSLKGLNHLDDENYIDAKVMHAKAHHKLQQNKEAIQLLESIHDHPQASDSNRLELVRLLVLEKQKSKALPMLKVLVSKHPKNLELLKSLIALEIDLSKLKDVDEHIKALAKNDKYKNKARYFQGEFSEKLGLQEKALESYSQVISGPYVKNAHKKLIHLTKIVHAQDVVDLLFKREQEAAKTLTLKAYWLKLQGDDFFENKQYKISLGLYNRAVILAPDITEYRYRRGLANERVGNLKQAESDFTAVLEKHDKDADTLSALGYMLLVHTDRLDEAKLHLSKAFTLKPNDPIILDSLGFVLFKTGDMIRAEVYLRKAYHLIKSPEVASHLIDVLVATNQYEEAKKIYQEIIRLYPNSPSLKNISHYVSIM